MEGKPVRTSGRRRRKPAALRDHAILTFHNYGPRIASSDGKGTDVVLDSIVVGGDLGVIKEPR